MRRPALLQLLPVTEPPKHAGRYHSGRRGRSACPHPCLRYIGILMGETAICAARYSAPSGAGFLGNSGRCPITKLKLPAGKSARITNCVISSGLLDKTAQGTPAAAAH